MVAPINAASAQADTAFDLEWISMAFDHGLENDELKMRPKSLQSVDGKLYQAILVMLKDRWGQRQVD